MVLPRLPAALFYGRFIVHLFLKAADFKIKIPFGISYKKYLSIEINIYYQYNNK